VASRSLSGSPLGMRGATRRQPVQVKADRVRLDMSLAAGHSPDRR